MKKILTSVLVIAMIFSLITGCGAGGQSPTDNNGTKETVSQSDSAKTTEPINDSMGTTEKKEEPININESTNAVGEKAESNEPKYFDYTAEEFVTLFDTGITSTGYKTILNKKPEIEEGNIAKYGAVRLYTYDLGTGSSLFLYADKEDDKVFNIGLYGHNNGSKKSDEYSFCQGLIIGMVDGDLSQGIIKKLNANNISEGKEASADGETGKYFYSESNDEKKFMVIPFEKKEEPISINESTNAIGKKSESNVPKYFNFSVEDFTESFDTVITSIGYKTILGKKPEIDEKTMDGYGVVRTYAYVLDSDIFLFLSETKEDKKVFTVGLYADIKEKKKLDEYAFCQGLIIGLIEPNISKEIVTELKVDRIPDGKTTRATGESGNYSYSLSGNKRNFIAVP